MKSSCLIKSMGVSFILSFCLFTLAYGMERANDITHHKVKEILEEHLKKNEGLMDSSKGKDIVVFLGNTGAGKSTLINYLSGKQLEVDGFDDIVLENQDDFSAMTIGKGADSETFLPRSIPVGNLLFYDLPGLKDTRGTARNLVNACFIKTIIENARSTKLVFVAGMGQVTDDRGESLKKLSAQVTQLVPDKSIKDFSILVITKSHTAKNTLPDLLARKLDLTNPAFSTISHWISRQKIDQVSFPRDGKVNYDNKESILKLIREMGHEQIKSIDIETIYDVNQQMAIRSIYDTEIEDIIEKLISQSCDYNNLGMEALEKKKNYITSDFNNHLLSSLESSPLIKLLRPISEEIYQISWNSKRQILDHRVNQIVGQIDLIIAMEEKKIVQKNVVQLQANVASYRAEVGQLKKQVADQNRRRRNGFEQFFHDTFGW